MTHLLRRNRCAARTFLHSLCGMLSVLLLFSLTGGLPQMPEWQLALLLAAAAGIAGGMAWMMN